jgi:hypothetical protein
VILGELGTYLLLDRLPPFDATTGLLNGEVPVVVVERGERVGSARVSMKISVPALFSAIQEIAADQERSCEVDASTTIFSGSVLSD